MDQLTAVKRGLHKMRVALGVQKISMDELPGGGAVINVEDYIKLGEAQRTAFEEELKRQTGSPTRIVTGEGGYITRIELQSMTVERGAEQLAGINGVLLKAAVDKKATMATSH